MNLGPLTTTFTPIGPNCASTFLAQIDTNSWLQYGTAGRDSLACLPSGFRHNANYYYSPGVCPSGYVSACSTLASTGSVVETIATCCPSGYSCIPNRNSGAYGCWSCFNDLQIFSVDSIRFLTDSDGVNTKILTCTTTFGISNDCVYAYGAIVHTVVDDIVNATTASSVSSVRTHGISGNDASTGMATAPGPTKTGESENRNTDQSLKVTTAAGIGVSFALGTILLSITIVFSIRSYRRRRQSSQRQDHYKPEQSSMRSTHCEHQHQEPQAFPYEMSAEREPGELSAETSERGKQIVV
ncbi:hypothetical protein F5X98DRAFT_380151 [Xylaria grammica]|nr:hypothetical protein F5X98DRAFT_380151 [Xylaria grammica]